MSTMSTKALLSGQPVRPAAALLATAAILAIFIWLFWAFIEQQVRFAITKQADWGHTLVIPFIAGWFIWLNRGRILAEPLRPSLTGLFVVFAGVAWYSFVALGPEYLRHHNVMGVGVGAVIFGLVLAFCGWRAMRWLWFPVAYLVIFGQTISDRFLDIVTFKLQGIATVGAEWGLSLIGYEVTRMAHTVYIHQPSGDVPVNIAEACSGMRMLVAFFALGVAMAYRGLDQVWQRVLLVAMAVPTAIFVNVLRVMTLGVLSTYDSGFATGEFHTMVGMLWLIPAFFIYLGVMWILRNLVVSDDEPAAEIEEPSVDLRFGPRVKAVFISGVALMITAGVAFSMLANALNVHLRKSPVPLRDSLSLIPSSLGEWNVVHEGAFDSAMIEQLGTELTISRLYQAGSDGPIVNFHLAYYTDTVDPIPHVPDRCMIAAGMEGITAEPENLQWAFEVDGAQSGSQLVLDEAPVDMVEVPAVGGGTIDVHMPAGEPLLRAMEFRDARQRDNRIWAGYFFITNGRMRPSPSEVYRTAYAGSEQYAYYCKVQVVFSGGGSFDKDEFLRVSGDFLSLAMPYIMRSLPDWANVLSGKDPQVEH
ncbi:MAG: exosortase [Phycisphaerales bacterium]|nr:exosortase [Phycisphaerales bacterium]